MIVGMTKGHHEHSVEGSKVSFDFAPLHCTETLNQGIQSYVLVVNVLGILVVLSHVRRKCIDYLHHIDVGIVTI